MKVNLFALLLPILGPDLGSMSQQVRGQNGFELWRLIAREKDPIMLHASFHMEAEIQKMAWQKCKSFRDTLKVMKELRTKEQDRLEHTGNTFRRDPQASSLASHGR